MASIPASEVLDINSLVEYQTGSVVSRQVVKNEGGNITLFAFDVGQELSEHTTPFDAFVHVLEGEGEIRIAGKVYLLKNGQGILMPADKPHAVKALQKFKMLLTMVR